MKRGGPLHRYTPLRPGKPLQARTGLKRTGRLRKQRKGRLAAIERECEVLWARYIKMRYSHRSVLSGESSPLDSAHVFPRTRLTTKFHPLNGVPLTRTEADYFTRNPAAFNRWIRKIWPHTELTVDELEQLSLTITHPTEEWFLEQRSRLYQLMASYMPGGAHA